MTRLLILLTFLMVMFGCDGPEPVAETKSAFVCVHYSSFTHLCTQWAPSLIPGSPTNYVPYGDPVWCPVNDFGQLQPGWLELYNDQKETVQNHNTCAFLPPGSYGNLGDWNYDSPGFGLPSVHVRAAIMGPQAYAFFWDQPNFGGNFIGFYGPSCPSCAVVFSSPPRSFQVVLGQ